MKYHIETLLSLKDITPVAFMPLSLKGFHLLKSYCIYIGKPILYLEIVEYSAHIHLPEVVFDFV